MTPKERMKKYREKKRGIRTKGMRLKQGFCPVCGMKLDSIYHSDCIFVTKNLT